MDSPRTVAVLVGRPTTHTSPRGREVRTAIRKHVVDGPVTVRATNIDGDEQADLRVHGGIDKAVLAYSADHAASWSELDPALAVPGAFGENLHVAGLTEADVCLGDRWSVGTAVFEVSQPRQPCWKLDDRWGRDDLVQRIEASGRSGWYLRVVAEGVLRAGDRWELIDQPHPGWSVARAHRVMHHMGDDIDASRELDAVAELAGSWHRSLQSRVQRLLDGTPSPEPSERRDGPGA